MGTVPHKGIRPAGDPVNRRLSPEDKATLFLIVVLLGFSFACALLLPKSAGVPIMATLSLTAMSLVVKLISERFAPGSPWSRWLQRVLTPLVRAVADLLRSIKHRRRRR